MTHKETIDFSTQAIRSVFSDAGISIAGIYLFGSRARGDFLPESDWDFLICSEVEIPFPNKAVLVSKIQAELAVRLIDADIIIKSENKLGNERDNVGVITHYALKDGVVV